MSPISSGLADVAVMCLDGVFALLLLLWSFVGEVAADVLLVRLVFCVLLSLLLAPER